MLVTAFLAFCHVVTSGSMWCYHTVGLPVIAIPTVRTMSSSVLSFGTLQYLSKLIIHDSVFFPSNFRISNLIRLHGSSVYV